MKRSSILFSISLTLKKYYSKFITTNKHLNLEYRRMLFLENRYYTQYEYKYLSAMNAHNGFHDHIQQHQKGITWQSVISYTAMKMKRGHSKNTLIVDVIVYNVKLQSANEKVSHSSKKIQIKHNVDLFYNNNASFVQITIRIRFI